MIEQAIKAGLNYCVSAYPRQVRFIQLKQEKYFADWQQALAGHEPDAVRAAFVEHCQTSDNWPTFADLKNILTRAHRQQAKTKMEVNPFKGAPAKQAVEFCRLLVSLLDYSDYLERDPTQPGKHRNRRMAMLQPDRLEAKREEWQAELLRRRETIGLAYQQLAKGTSLETSRWNAFFSRLAATGEIPPTPHSPVVRGEIASHPYTLTTDGQGRDTVTFPGREYSWQAPPEPLSERRGHWRAA